VSAGRQTGSGAHYARGNRESHPPPPRNLLGEEAGGGETRADAAGRAVPRFFVIADADLQDFLPLQLALKVLFASAITAITPGA